MPNHRTHLATGILIWGSLTYTCHALGHPVAFIYYPLMLTFCLVGSIFPDIDTASKMQRMFLLLLLVCLPIALLTYHTKAFIGLASALFVALLVRHRTLTHSVIFLLLLTAGATWTIAHHYPFLETPSYYGALFFASGALSHVALDLAMSAFKQNRIGRK